MYFNSHLSVKVPVVKLFFNAIHFSCVPIWKEPLFSEESPSWYYLHTMTALLRETPPVFLPSWGSAFPRQKFSLINITPINSIKKFLIRKIFLIGPPSFGEEDGRGRGKRWKNKRKRERKIFLIMKGNRADSPISWSCSLIWWLIIFKH